MLYVEYLDKDLFLKDIFFKKYSKFVDFFESDDIIVLSVYNFKIHDYEYLLDKNDFEIIIRLKKLLNNLDNFKLKYIVR